MIELYQNNASNNSEKVSKNTVRHNTRFS